MNENASTSLAMYVDVNSQRYPLKLGQIYMFGRELPTEVVCPEHIINVDEKDVDEKHCCVADSVEEGAFVFDLLSKYGTFLNGDRLKPLEKTFIKHGDVMRLGTTRNVKFYNDQMETSHNSSGYGEANKNTSDIICTSPELTSQKDSRLKLVTSCRNKSLDDTDKFLVPAVPNRSVRIDDGSFVATEADNMSNRRVSLGLNSPNNQTRRSDSFIIPETQHFKPRTSTGSNLSIAESDADEERTKSDFNLDSFGVNDNDEEFCIPETQDIVLGSQRPRSLRDGKVDEALKTLEERSVDLNDSDDEDLLDGSQFRICTQDYNEGFGEEDNESMLHSQVIPLIKHTTVLLNGSNEKRSPDKSSDDEVINEANANAVQEEDSELANINWVSSAKSDAEQTKNINSTCSTPDIFDFAAFDNSKAENANENDENLFEDNALDDEKDYMATQVFPSRNGNNKTSEQNKVTKEKDILSGKDDEQYLTLSDKENLQPERLEPITDLPPTQLFAIREVSGERSLASTSLRKSGLNQTEPKQAPITVETLPVPTITIESNNKLLSQAPLDEEDDILTQAFPQPSKTSTTAVLALPKNNCLNSTLLDDKAVDKNLASFFAEMEKTPKKHQTPTNTVDVFKIPELGFSNLKKSSSIASTASNVTVCSESDMDLLMCTPQIIKDHLEFSKPDDLRKNILAAKNKNLFGDDTDDGEDTEDDRNSRDKCLVQLINVPKNSKDFDKLLPHLKNEDNRLKMKSVLTDEQNAAKAAYKEYKFNISFGHEQEKSIASTSKSATLSRDERHAARDKEREIEQKRDPKRASIGDDKKQESNVKRMSTRRKRNDEATTAGKAADAIKVKDKGTEEKQKKQEEVQEAASKKKEKSSMKKKEDESPTAGKATDRIKVKDKGTEERQPNTKQKKEDGNTNQVKELQEAAFRKQEKSSLKEKEAEATTAGKATVAIQAKDKDIEQQQQNTKQSIEEKKEQEAALKKKEQSIPKMNEDKDAKKKPEKSNKVAKDNDKEGSESTATSVTNKTDDANKEEQEEKRPRRGRKRTISTNKTQESGNKQENPTKTEIDLQKVRLTRLKSTTGGKEKPAKEKKPTSSSATSVAAADEMDLVPTQPLRRTTRTFSRSNQKDPNESISSAASTSTTVSRASSANRSLNRSSSRLSVSNNVVANESATKAVTTTTPSSSKPTLERKRKAEVPVPPQPNTEEKRLRRTTSEDSTNSLNPIKTTPSRCLISMTMVDPVKFKELAIKADGIWAVAKDPAHSNVLVMDKAFRTFKFLLAMARGIPIVTSQWLKQINDTKSLQKSPINEYLFYDPVFEKRHKFSLAKSLQMAKKNNSIFKGYEFVMTSNIQPQPVEIQPIIESAGGTVLTKGPTPARDNQQIYLVSSVEDRKNWHKYRRLNKNIVIVSTEAIMSSVMRQNCTSLSNYVLS